ncbi:glycosyltransferase [Pseudomonas frederiksbergensis]|uniref:glycosyltransferase n=1 Tax=Pseudomonas frederiksbergensis TaxID=104087 RepID=UPI002DB5DB98|nr:glycosyltransferase [Pseudomonas frederiksbergensis]WRV66825.1 glycosyltransferase [Pseudomonas frederiksbergensis]
MIGYLKSLFKSNAMQTSNEFDICMDGNVGGLNILIYTENVNATYFISFDIPLREMHQRGEVNFAVVSQNLAARKGVGYWKHWDAQFEPELVVMTRYGQPFGTQILDHYKSKKIPVVYHIDDNLLEVPDSLGVEIKKRQGAQDVIDARRYQLGNCDLIYASTPYLAGLLGNLFTNQAIYHGMYAPYMGDRVNADRQPRPWQTVGYMGSKGHQKDLDLVVPALERLLEERPQLRFEVFGTIQMPKRLERFGERVRSHSVNKAYSEFLSVLAGLSWDIGLAPLANEEFNLCKAPTKFIEYTAAGIPVIASDIPVYSSIIPDGGGVLVGEDWYGALNNCLDIPGFWKSSVDVAQMYCAENFSINRLEQQLLSVFEEVTKH